MNVEETSSDFQQTSNVPASVSSTDQPSTSDLFIEANRLATYKNWPNPNISPQSLAKAGFYYLNRSDEVKCAWCKGVIAKWEPEDDAFDEHKRFFPNCPRVNFGPLLEIASNGIQSLGIQQNSPPKQPKYSSLDARLRTFTNWPINYIQQPKALAIAGFYYQGENDQVRCFHCYIGLRSWQKEDDPWFEHAKWCPQCQFVRLAKGPDYVQEVQELTQRTQQQQHSQQQQASAQPTAPPPCPPMSIDEAMSSGTVRQALEIGIDAGTIRTVTQRRLLERGSPYRTVEDLVRAVFDERQDDETADHQEEASSHSDNVGASMLREVSRLFHDILNDSNEDIVGISGTQRVSNDQSYDIPPPIRQTTQSIKTDVAPEREIVATQTTSAAAAALAGNVVDRSRDEAGNSNGEMKVRTVNGQTIRSPPSPTRSLSLEEENRLLKDARLCKVCLDEEVGVVFLPCGHLVTCIQCANGVMDCPMCRTTIKGFVRTYLS